MRRLGILVGLLLILAPVTGYASEITVRPFLIDETMLPRDSVMHPIRLTSDYDTRKSIVYATVNEITVGPEGDIKSFVTPVETDRSRTITSWVEITRGRIEVPAGESVEVPLTISVNPNAVPGEYHAFIGLVETSKRNRAEAIARAGDADGVIVKITVADERVDSMKISSLVVDRFVTNPAEQQVQVTIENPGEIASAPTGELIFYNNRGVEVAATPVNEAGTVIEPGNTETFAVAVPFAGDLGRFKANVNLRYGSNQQASLFDSTGFFMLPVWYVGLFIFGFTVLVILFTILFRRALSVNQPSEHGDDVSLYVRDGQQKPSYDHDIDLSKKTD